MNFEISGKLFVKEDTQAISASFKKREFVIEVENERNPEWNDFVKFQSTQDRCNLLDNFNLGDQIKVSFNVRGRKWEKNGQVSYFTNLEAWRIEAETITPSAPVDGPVSFTETEIPPAGDDSDLPF